MSWLRKHEKCFSVLVRVFARREGKEQFTLYYCYLSIQKHFQSSAKYCIRRGEITRKGNPCESSAKLENHFCDVLIECENDFSAFLLPQQEWNTKFIDLWGSSSFVSRV